MFPPPDPPELTSGGKPRRHPLIRNRKLYKGEWPICNACAYPIRPDRRVITVQVGQYALHHHRDCAEEIGRYP